VIVSSTSVVCRGVGVGAAVVVLLSTVVAGEAPALRLRAAAIDATGARLTIEVLRWSTDGERAPVMAALSAPAPARAPAAAAPAGGRGGRGGRGGAPPPSPTARLEAAIRAAPTVGFIWGDGPTGYSIKYAWRAAASGGPDRLIIVTDRRFGPHVLAAPPAAAGAVADADVTVIEARLDGNGTGQAKTSLVSKVAIDATAGTLSLEDYGTAPAQLTVTR
jgi:hypothetical protein